MNESSIHSACRWAALASRGMELTETEVAVLDLERGRWLYAGAKETAIHGRFGWTRTRYAQVLDALMDRPEAMAHDPLLVRRLLRLRQARRDARTALVR